MDLSQHLTMGQLAQRLGISTERVQQLRRAGRFEVLATPLGHLISPESVEHFVEERRRQSAAA